MKPVRLAMVLVLVCILSAGIGSGATLLAKTGPEGVEGPQGAQGLPGQRGATGPEGYIDTDNLGLQSLESEAAELREGVEWTEGELSNLESQLSNVEFNVSELCEALDTFC